MSTKDRSGYRPGGATLLEFLIAVVILVLMTTLGINALRTTVKSSELIQAAGQDNEVTSVAQRFLRQTLRTAQPLSGPAPGGRNVVLFDGDGEKLTFVARLARYTDPGRLYLVTLHSQPTGDSGYALMAHYRPLAVEPTASIAVVDPDSSATTSVELYRSEEPVRLYYLREGATSANEQWQSSWRGQTRLPRIVRVAQEGTVGPLSDRWSPIEIALAHASVPVWMQPTAPLAARER